jgi:hypothetical protein
MPHVEEPDAFLESVETFLKTVDESPSSAV